MLLASKYEEMYAPEIQDFVTITDNAYTKAQIRKMEALIFRKLGFNLSKPLCLHFLRRNSKAGAVWVLLDSCVGKQNFLQIIIHNNIPWLAQFIKSPSSSYNVCSSILGMAFFSR